MRFLVTGGSQGIGAAVVEQARQAGHQVVLTGRDAARVQEITGRTGAHGLRADVGVADDNARTIQACQEHMGGVDPSKGIDGEGFKFVLECLDTGRCWVKLSPRISKQDNFPFSDTDPLVKKLVQHAPNRLLWGSDWPHPQYFKPMPNDVALLDMMLDWVPDEKARKLIFVDNPAELFGFPKT